MTCCTPFSAAGTAAIADPTRHVNFTTGMVLGVEDYHVEFAYHSARSKWIMRECGGYGTLAGLSVAIEPDGAKGPRVRVGAGSAAAPSGQLICVGADQCANLNAWLAREDVAARVTAIANATPPGDKARLNLWLTLCYTDCAVSPVPIPGQPCRSEEDLMAPSRISDDYVLSLSLDPPVMAEARALAMLPTLIGAWDLTGSGAGLPARKALRGALETQLSALFGPATVPMAAAGLAPPKLDPALKPFALSEMRRIWLTRIRPHLMAQRCADGASGEDCVLLARINLPVMKVGTHWEVGDGSAPVEDSIALDEQERPFVVAGALAASAIGVAAPDEPRPGEYAVVTAAGNLPDTISIAAIRLGAAGIITLAAGAGAGKPRTVWLRNLGAAAATLKVAASGKIDGQPAFPLDPGTAVLLAADGLGNWTRASGGGA